MAAGGAEAVEGGEVRGEEVAVAEAAAPFGLDAAVEAGGRAGVGGEEAESAGIFRPRGSAASDLGVNVAAKAVRDGGDLAGAVEGKDGGRCV